MTDDIQRKHMQAGRLRYALVVQLTRLRTMPTHSASVIAPSPTSHSSIIALHSHHSLSFSFIVLAVV